MSGKVKNKLFITGLFLVIVLFFFQGFPFIFMGSPAPIFQVYNDDIKSHEVTVEVLSENNKSVINETYNIESEGDFSQARPLSLWLPQSNQEYTFKVTMDKQITDTVKIEIPNQYSGVTIRLYSKNYESGENVPIFIEIVGQL